MAVTAPKFRVVQLKLNGTHQGYTIYFDQVPFLRHPKRGIALKRHQAYAIARLLNHELKNDRRWAVKFSDPYV